MSWPLLLVCITISRHSFGLSIFVWVLIVFDPPRRWLIIFVDCDHSLWKTVLQVLASSLAPITTVPQNVLYSYPFYSLFLGCLRAACKLASRPPSAAISVAIFYLRISLLKKMIEKII